MIACKTTVEFFFSSFVSLSKDTLLFADSELQHAASTLTEFSLASQKVTSAWVWISKPFCTVDRADSTTTYSPTFLPEGETLSPHAPAMVTLRIPFSFFAQTAAKDPRQSFDTFMSPE